MKKDELIEKWNNAVKELPNLTSETEYDCPKCSYNFALIEGDTEIGKWGMDVNCPKCGSLVKFEPLGYSKFD